jgi:5-methylcytosine-specific restriction endonuclease McrA
VQPHRGNAALFWSVANWQPLCDRCHGEKTRRGE